MATAGSLDDDETELRVLFRDLSAPNICNFAKLISCDLLYLI